MTELCELRDALSTIKQNAEQYVQESKSASKSLQNLSKSLEVLRTLKIYQEDATPTISSVHDIDTTFEEDYVPELVDDPEFVVTDEILAKMYANMLAHGLETG